MKKSFCSSPTWQLLAFNLVSCSLAYANPSGPTVKSGEASFESPDAKTLSITTSDKAIIHWNDFSIADGELTQFVQPSSHSVVVNKVTSDLSSILLGSLKANGNVYLLNPNGILIGENGSIDTNSFIASTLNACSHALVDSAEEIVFNGTSTAKIVNIGQIRAWDGDVALIGYQIENPGGIIASNGTIAMGAGQNVLLQPLSNEKIVIRPSLEKYDNELTGIDHSGAINACRAELKADGNAYAMAIHHKGVIDALGTFEQNGEVFLVAENGNNGVYGSIAAKNVNDRGGSIQILGDHIVLFDQAHVDTSGKNGGGPILIGGDLSGKNPDVINASSTYIAKEATITSDAIQDGDAGKVIVWADQSTFFYGNISARGGQNSGDGGFVEISGKKYLDFRGEADRFAVSGKSGTLLLDPTDITYNFAINQFVTAAPTFAPDLTNCPSEVATNFVDIALSSGPVTIQSSAGNAPNPCISQPGNVIIDTTHTITSNFDLTFDTVTPGVGSIILNAGRTLTTNGPGNVVFKSSNDIIINGNFLNVGSGSTTLTAANDIVVNNGGSVTNFGGTGGTMTFTATRDINVIGGNVLGSGNANGPFTVTAGRDLNVTGGTTSASSLQSFNTITAGRDINVTGTGEFAQINNVVPISATITATTGNVTVLGGTANFGGNGYAAINSLNLTLNVPQGNVLVHGGPSGLGANFAILSANFGTLTINCSGNVTSQGGSAPSGNSGSIITNTLGTVLINAGGNVNVIAGVFAGFGNSGEITTGLGGGSIFINTPNDVNVIGGVFPSVATAGIATGLQTGNITINANNVNLIGNNGQAGITTHDGDTTIIAANAVNLTPGPSFSSSYIWNLVGTAPRKMLVIAGTDIVLGGTNSVLQSLIQNFSVNGTVTLVCDNNFPTQPFLGPGKFINHGTVSTVGGELWVFTSLRPLNTQAGLLNGVSFIPGPIYVDSTSEKWFTWYNNTSNGFPYKIFYKDQPMPTTTQLQTAVTLFNTAAYEWFQRLRDYDVFWYWRTDFTSEYAQESYDKFHHHQGLTSSDVLGKQKYHLLRKSYKESNGKVVYLVK